MSKPQVLQDMLSLLKESVQSKHAERLEQIVIALIGIEIGGSSYVNECWLSMVANYMILSIFAVLGVITILVDLFSA